MDIFLGYWLKYMIMDFAVMEISHAHWLTLKITWFEVNATLFDSWLILETIRFAVNRFYLDEPSQVDSNRRILALQATSALQWVDLNRIKLDLHSSKLRNERHQTLLNTLNRLIHWIEIIKFLILSLLNRYFLWDDQEHEHSIQITLFG